jgi:hypothetical protein
MTSPDSVSVIFNELLRQNPIFSFGFLAGTGGIGFAANELFSVTLLVVIDLFIFMKIKFLVILR